MTTPTTAITDYLIRTGTVSLIVGANHDSGYTANSTAHKLLRKLYEVLVNIGWSQEAAKSAISDGEIDSVDEFVNLKDTEMTEVVKSICVAATRLGL